MDRPTPRTEADALRSRPDPDWAFVLPSRRPALDLCRASTRGSTGPVLLTGDSGVGKSWLCRRLEFESRAECRWVGVDLTPADDPTSFYRLIARELGLIDPGVTTRTPSRIELLDYLDERRASDDRVALVIEEAQNLSADVWEEVRVLASRLDRPGGFRSMILVGLTSLALRFATRPFAAIEGRLASRVHLGPIDLDDARILLDRLRPGRVLADQELELLHRDAWGNPRRLLRMVRLTSSPAIDPPKPPSITMSESTSPADEESSRVAPPAPLMGSGKPPIQVEDNMIEVGWSPEDVTKLPDPESLPASRIGRDFSADAGEESVQDHYAALQAWREWSENQARRTPTLPEPIKDEPEFGDEEDEAPEDDRPLPRADRPTIRVESEQKFAPFGHLFSRMAQAREPE